MAPVAPVTPGAPVGPLLPGAPVEPLAPVGPVAPVAPVAPAGPGSAAALNTLEIAEGLTLRNHARRALRPPRSGAGSLFLSRESPFQHNQSDISISRLCFLL